MGSGLATVVTGGPNGHQCIEFTGTNNLVSANQSAWSFVAAGPLHILVFVRHSLGTTGAELRIIGNNRSSTANVGFLVYVTNSSTNQGTPRALISDSQSGYALFHNTNNKSLLPINQWHLLEWLWTSASTPNSKIISDGSIAHTVNAARTPANTNPSYPTSLGGDGGNVYSPAGFQIGRMLIYNTLDYQQDARNWMLSYGNI